MVPSCMILSRRPGSNPLQYFSRKFGSSGDNLCSSLPVLVLVPLPHTLILQFDPPRATLHPQAWPTAQYSYSACLSQQAFFIAQADSYILLINLAIINSILLEKTYSFIKNNFKHKTNYFTLFKIKYEMHDLIPKKKVLYDNTLK